MPPPLWPVGSGFECFYCGCRFEVEAGDDFDLPTEERLDGISTMKMPCPDCGIKLKATRPRSTSSTLFLQPFIEAAP